MARLGPKILAWPTAKSALHKNAAVDNSLLIKSTLDKKAIVHFF